MKQSRNDKGMALSTILIALFYLNIVDEKANYILVHTSLTADKTDIYKKYKQFYYSKRNTKQTTIKDLDLKNMKYLGCCVCNKPANYLLHGLPICIDCKYQI